MAIWNFENNTVTFGTIDFTRPSEQLANELGLNKASTEKLIAAALAIENPANRQVLLRKIVNTAIALGAKAASGGVTIASLLA